MLTDIKKEDYSLFPLNNVQQAYYMGRIDLFEIGNISTGGYSEFVVDDLSVENLEKALNRLVLRHAGLRTVFTDQGQQILPADNCHYSIPVNKITTEEALLDIRNRLLNMKVDVARFPIIVIEVSEYKGSYVIHFMFDAIIMDNNSMRIFFTELVKIYNNLDIVLPTLHITYHEYILALQRIRDSKLFDKAKTYWETKLEDYDFSCNLPIVIEPSMVKQSTTKRGLRIIEKETYDMLQEKLAKIQLSPTSLLLSLYGKVLCRWSGQDKFSINLTLFNRLPLHKEVNDILGDFTNLELYNYDDVKSRDIVEHYLKGVQNVLWDDIENNLFDGIDFQRLIRERKQWSISKPIAPIVLTSVLGFKEKKEEGDVVNLFGRQHYSISRTSQVWIDNAVYEDYNGNLILRWDFVEQLFLPEVIEGMLDEYAYLIRKIAAMDIQRDRLEFYRLPATYQHIIEKYNATVEEYDVKTIIDFYDNCVIQDACKCNAIAVVEGGNNKQAYKHREVAIGSKNIATHLYKYYKEEQTVAILSEKGYNQVVSSLGIMQSGKAYIPLNIHWSVSRILEIMEESGTKVLLISKKEYEHKRQLQVSNIRLLIIEELLTKEREKNIHLPIVLLSDIAYIIYTSGSTGKPKGVAISHENMMNTLIAVNNRYKVTEKDSVLALSELSFDLSVYDIFGLLLVGGRIVFVNDEERQDPQHWLSLIEKHKITLWNTVPQLAELLVDEARAREMRLDSIRLYLLSGDWLPLQLPDKIKRQSKDTQVISLGGATEGSVWSIWYEIKNINPDWKSIPYGYPMPNQQIYILNHELIHSPVGVEGDIYIGGKGVAQGYWNNQEQTDKQFVVYHELGRIYKTGDRGILHAEGWVEFRGRKDFQVKIRGYRVELEEIENKLNKLEGVKQSAVQLFKKNNSEVLVGFVVREQLITKGADENFDKEVFKLEQRGIRKDLTDTITFNDNVSADKLSKVINDSLGLPDYMSLQEIVFLDSMPLTANGKLDKSRLPKPEIEWQSYIAPVTKEEQEMVEIWSEILNIGKNKIGIEDSFFNLGGHSITAIRLISKINSRFNFGLSFKDLFEYPTIRGLIKNSITLKQREQEGDYIPYQLIDSSVVISKEDYEDCYPAGMLQLGMFFEQEKLGHGTYLAFQIQYFLGKYNREKLERCLQTIINRHDILRTEYRMLEDGNIYAMVQKRVEVKSKLFFVTDSIEEVRKKEIALAFNREIAGLYRFYIIEQAEGFVLFFSFHHAILDGYSLNLFIRELVDLYQHDNDKLYEEEQSKLLYGEFIRNELSALKNEDTRLFWREYLAESILLTPQWNFSKSKGVSVVAERQQIEGLRLRQIEDIASKYSCTVEELLLLSYMTVLSLFFNERDITIGLEKHNRIEKEGGDRQLGLFVTMLPFRYELRDKEALGTALSRLRDSVKKIVNHKQYPYNEIKQQLGGRDLFDIAYSYNDFSNFVGNEKIAHINEFLNEELGNITSILFICKVYKYSGGYGFVFSGHSNSVDQAYLSYFVRYYNSVLDQLCKEERVVFKLMDEDYQYLVYDYNKTEKEYPKDKTIHQLFEEQVERTPNNIAVVFEEKQLTYQELNNKANQLANYLHNNYQTKADDIICLLLERSEWMIISILGVLKSGAAYCPISPEYPEERILFILRDTQPKCLITNCKLKIENVQFPIVNVIDEELLKVLASLTINHLPLIISPHALAYIIYTSGTTGNSKGVMIEHATFSHAIQNLIALFSKSLPSFNTYSTTNYTFDIFGLEYVLPLLHGNLLTLGSMHENLNFNLYDFIQITPTVLQSYLSNINEINPNLIWLIGGEKVPMALLTDILKRSAKREVNIYNVYGPTETTIWSVVYFYNRRAVELGIESIGKPIDNTVIYILDSDKRLLPMGAMGELYIGGDGVAGGYLNRPELTAEKFISNPFQTEEEKQKNRNSRLYKTGDLVRMLPDGNIEYIGRNDFQVKIRGYRIELGEIENRIQGFQTRIEGLKDEQVIEQAVVLVNEKGDNKYLVGYFVANEQVDIEELRNYLSKQLPEYMVPTGLVQIEQMPITENGKLDRKALLNIEYKISDEVIELPKNNREERLLKIWSNLLQISESELSVTQSFFRLGGNSILSIRLMNIINKEFNTSFSIRIIFERNTIRQLAEYLLEGNIEIIAVQKQSFNSDEEQVLSYAQNRLWFIYQYDKKNSAVYNIPMVFEMDKSVDKEKLKESLLFVVEKHEVLRTIIKENEKGISYQSVKTISENLIQEEIYISKSDVEKRISNAIRYSFQLDKELPIQIKFFMPKKKDDTIVLTIVVHHIAFDGWSVEVFQKEVYHAYQLLVNQKPLIHTTNTQYKDYALWQRDFLKGERWGKELNYWKEQLDGYNNSHLPVDFSRPLEINYEGDAIVALLSKETSQNLKAVAKELNASLYSVLLSGYYLFLSAYNNEQDIVVGSPFANRHYAGTENMIGFFVNSLVLRVHIDFKDTLKAYIEKVNAIVEQGQNNQDIPFEQLVEELHVERDMSRHPIFQIMFGVQDFGGGDTTLFKTYQNNRTNTIPAKFDVTTMVSERNDGLQIYFNYATALYKRETIDRFVKTYECILTQIVRNRLDNDLKSIRFVNNEEYNYLLYDYNKTEKEYPKDKTIHQLFEEQVVRTPNNIAVVFEEKQLTYQELNDKANQLAHYLHNNYQTKADDIICLLLKRSEWMIIAILGVLKSGAAYCPISPEYPEERILFILQDTQPKCLITNCKLKIENVQFSIINLIDEEFLKVLASLIINHLPLTISDRSLAYIIYTSGTTGNPKGVMVEHKNVVNLLYATAYILYPINQTCLRASVFTSYQFDVSVSEFLSPLVQGGELHIFNELAIQNISLLSQYIIEKSINYLYIPPVLLSQLPQRIYPELKHIIYAGEPCNRNIANDWSKNYLLFNYYGPTESTIYALGKQINIDEVEQIGKPIDNIKIYLLNTKLQVAPIGSIVELYIGGDGLARGYLNRPELTAEKFISNPFQTEEDKKKNRNNRLYKTGDVVRMLPDGNIEYIGRNDFQVKIRGYRIELGEIENRIQGWKNGEVIQQVVVLLNEKGDNKYLVGYFVAREQIDVEELRSYLSKQLPEYMVPTGLVQIEQMPLTVNGKLDRKALLAIEYNLADSNEYKAPTNELEQQLLSIWEKLLGNNNIGVEDDFFRVGGDSIRSIQLSSQLRAHMGVDISVKDIFQYRTIAQLSEQISFNFREKEVVRETGRLEGEVGLLPIQKWFFEKDYPNPDYFNQAFEIKTELLNKEVLIQAIAALVDYHDAFRLSYKKDEAGNIIQYYDSTKPMTPVVFYNLTNYKDKVSQKRIWYNQGHQGLDIWKGNLYKIFYMEDEEEKEAYIGMIFHHLIIDGVSWRILYDDLFLLYQGKSLGDKKTSYRQWVNSLLEYGAQIDSSWDAIYKEWAIQWQEQNEEFTRWSDNEDNCFVTISLSKEETEQLIYQGNKPYHTEINDLLLYSLVASFRQVFGKSDLFITLESHGREEWKEEIRIGNTMGWFTTMHPVCLSVGEDISESIISIKERLHSIERNGLGYGIRWGYSNMPCVVFNYLGVIDGKDRQQPWSLKITDTGIWVDSKNVTVQENGLQIGSVVENGQFRFMMTGRLSKEKMGLWGQAWEMELKNMIQHLLKRNTVIYSPSDFKDIRSEVDVRRLIIEPNKEKRYDWFEMTDLQKAYLLGRLDNFEIGGISNTIYIRFCFSEIDIKELNRALNQLIVWQPALRTIFSMEILKQRYLRMEEIDVYTIEEINLETERYTEVHNEEIANRVFRKDYDAGKFPLFHFVAVRYNDIVVLHHSMDLIILDAQSRQSFWTILIQLYKNKDYQPAFSAISFKDYQDIVSQLRYSSWYERDKRYWEEKLSNMPGKPPLLGLEDTSWIKKAHFSEHTLFVDKSTWMSFCKKIESYRLSPAGVILALFGKVIGYYSGVAEFLITITLFNRYHVHKDVNQLWGDFTNTDFFHFLDVGGLFPTIERTSRRLLDDIEHQLYGGQNVQRDWIRAHVADIHKIVSPIVFTGVFNTTGWNDNIVDKEKYFPGEYIEKRYSMGQTSQAWIDLQAIGTEEGFSSKWLFVSELFSKEQIGQMNGQMIAWIEWLSKNDWKEKCVISPLSAFDRNCIFEYEERGRVLAPKIERSWLQEYEEKVIQNLSLRDRVSVIDSEQNRMYTHKEIWDLSKKIASILVSEDRTTIAILSEKGMLQVVSAIGIMQSGQAYIPLNIHWSVSRILEIMEESGTKVLLISKKEYEHKIQLQGSNIRLLIIEELLLKEQEGDISLPAVLLSDIAYIIYTSGSTGKPKGVAISHENMMNTLIAVNNRYKVTEKDSVLALSELSFDLSVYDIFGLLLVGGRIIFVNDEERQDPQHWLSLIEKHKITLWNTVPQLADLLVDEARTREMRLDSIRLYLLSGDWLPLQLPDKIKRQSKDTQVISLGGATEGSVWSIWYEIKNINPDWKSIPYGYPMPNQQIYILNHELIHSPVGVEGDIYIGGKGVAQGYWNNQEQTDKQFVVHHELGRYIKQEIGVFCMQRDG